MNKKFYLTTAIPYVNAKPHIGHALEFVQADCVARYHKLLGEEVCLLSGADENALKNLQAAEKEKISVQDLVDRNAKYFEGLANRLNINFDIFQKGSDQKNHFKSSQYLWNLCYKNGDIYKKSYEGLYCLGCETFYMPEELDKNRECAEHPGKKLEMVAEENYYFKLSKYQNELVELISSDKLKIIPNYRKNEMLSFLKQPLLDISISRTNERAKNWGVPVPNDSLQRIYVWFDALNIYQSGVGFGWEEEKYQKWWPADLHIIGKGITRFHTVYWPAFLLSAKLSLPKEIFVHGYLTIDGQKMSKTLGNVVDPFEMVLKYGTDAIRYYLLREIPAYDDGDFSEKRLVELYNADLANGLGNLIQRVSKLVENSKFKIQNLKQIQIFEIQNYKQYNELFAEYRFNEILELIWKKVAEINRYIDQNEPWKLTGDKLQKVLFVSVDNILEIAILLQPFLPETAEKILSQFTANEIKVQPALFPRIK